LGTPPPVVVPQRKAHQAQGTEGEEETLAGALFTDPDAGVRQGGHLAATTAGIPTTGTPAASITATRNIATTGDIATRGVERALGTGSVADRDGVAGVAAAVDVVD
jgi:hypothetical protein